MKRLVVLLAGAALAAAAPAAGADRLRAVSVCGPELCNIARDPALVADMERLLASRSSTGPAPIEPFFGVDTITIGGAAGAGEFFPERNVLRWRPPSGPARWIPLPERIAASLRTTGRGAEPYQPGILAARVDGRPADDPGKYTALLTGLESERGAVEATVPLTLRFRKVGRRPWPARFRYAPSADTLVIEGRRYKVDGETAKLIERDAGLGGGGSGDARWALAGALVAALAAGAIAARRRARR